MRIRALASSLPLALVLGCGASSAGGASHPDSSGREPIRFQRHVAVGTHWIDVAQHRERSTQVTSVGGSVVATEEETTAIDLEARITVLAAGADGDPSRLRVEVRSFAATRSSGAPSPTLPPVLLVERGEPGSIVGEGGEAFDEETLDLLRDVLPTTHGARGPGDRIFGSETPRAPGESWPLDAAEIAGSMSADTFRVRPENVTGSTTFVERATVSGTECLVLRAQMDFADVEMLGMPEGVEVRAASMRFAAEGAMPRDQGIPMLRDVIDFTVHTEIVATPPDQAPMLLVIDAVEQTMHARTID